MGEAIEQRPSLDARERSKLAMTVVLVSLTMLFATLFLMIALYRLQNEVWPPMGMPRIPLLYPGISSFVLLLSELCFWSSKQSKQNLLRNPFQYVLGIGFGGAFLVSQIVLWQHMSSIGLTTDAGIFSSIIYALTWIHAGHIVVGLFLLGWSAMQLGDLKAKTRVENVEKVWHFLSVVWLLCVLVLFVF